MAKYTIAKLLKAKSRIVAEIAELRGVVSAGNSYNEKELDKAPVREAFNRHNALTLDLIKIKTAITKGNEKIQPLIFELAEIKGQIAWLQRLPTRRGEIREADIWGRDTDPSVTVLLAEIKADEKTQLLAAWKSRVEEIQDQLDEYNASTKVEANVTL